MEQVRFIPLHLLIVAIKRYKMNKNSVAIISLCSTLCQGSTIPLMPQEWGELALILMKKGIQPQELLEYSYNDFIEKLGASEEYAKRLADLISRTASLYFELSKYENMGIGVVTRADSTYPREIKKSLGNNCPPLFYYAGDLSIFNKENVQITEINQPIDIVNDIPTVKFAKSIMKEMKSSAIVKAIQKRKLLILAQMI